MDKPTKLFDDMIKAVTPQPNASVSESIACYKAGIELLKNVLDQEFKTGYAQAEIDLKKKKINHQVKNN